MDPFPSSWSEILEEMLPRGDCSDLCVPPLDIGPPPPVPANFQDRALLAAPNCNVCNGGVAEVEMRPIQVTDASLLPVAATFVVGILFVLITVIVLLLKIKKCQGFVSHSFCWIFPRSVLPHTELAPSSLPSPSPSMEKLKDSRKRPWHHASQRSVQSENIYEVCSPPSPDSLYEEVGPGIGPGPYGARGPNCNPYGVVAVENAFNAARNQRNGFPLDGTRLAMNNRFSTFGGRAAHGFVNPVVQDTQTLRSSSFRPGFVQKRELPPVPRGNNY